MDPAFRPIAKHILLYPVSRVDINTRKRLHRFRRPLYSTCEGWILMMGNLAIMTWFF